MHRAARAAAVGAMAAAAAVLLTGGPASAHAVAPGVRNVLDGVSPSLPGVSVAVDVTAADELVLANATPTPLEVLAPTGEPFLRISASGVEANVNSVGWYASESLAYTPIVSVPGVDPARGPTWVNVSRTGRWWWFDPRLRPDQPEDVVPTGDVITTLRLASWTVPVRLGTRTAQIRGHREYHRVQGSYGQRIDSTTDPAPGVHLAVVGGAGTPTPAVYLADTGSATVTVTGDAGEPLLRFGPDGVEANAASPSWLLTAASRSEPPTGPVGATIAARWVRVTTEHAFTWFDDRGDAPGVDAPRGRGSTGAVETVKHWSLPISVGDRAITVRLAVLWQPLTPAPPGPTGFLTTRRLLAMGVGAVAGGAVALLVVLARRRPATR